MSRDVIVVIGVGGIGQAIARRQGFGRTLLLADWNNETLSKAAKDLSDAGYSVVAQIVDVTNRESVQALASGAADLGPVTQVINTAGLSPNMASVEKVLEVDLYGSALVFEVFGEVIAPGGSGLIISSMAGHMMRQLPEADEKSLAETPADQLLSLPCLQSEAVPNTLVAYMVAKRANFLRVQAEAIRWGERGARVNAISPGIIVTPLAAHELNSEIGDIYRAMVQASPSKRMAPPEEIAVAASFLLGPDAGFITGSDLLIDGGVIAAMRAGKLPTPG
ncbi:SDR family oxidoreductase [Asticcacaulis excentricus]|uniref:Short-chain dehydrogenase/oxidoreductase n=1 Tax=Asticcacaulis excentricus TaxID=78587 RepID=A0A3G9G9X0_9CAUL|nr:SDR family oxidoreductase [Asticcacaulis excentricus]BBF82691.1 short-chain dehydrogenase/oxidoreductase [Asticcacaulis excentricus]